MGWKDIKRKIDSGSFGGKKGVWKEEEEEEDTAGKERRERKDGNLPLL